MTSLTIRMGAAHWDATLPDGTRFDFRTMTSAQRREWYGVFMSAVRSALGSGDSRPKRRWRSRKVRRGGRS